jgi:hypothetical protein
LHYCGLSNLRFQLMYGKKVVCILYQEQAREEGQRAITQEEI